MRKRTSTSTTPDMQAAAMHELAADASSGRGMSRRHFLTSSATGVVAGAIATEALVGAAPAADRGRKGSGPGGMRGGRTLLKGGCVVSLDASVGDLETADVLIEGSKIVAVQPNLKASAEVIDASNMIVMPGFVDTHRHIWEGQLRNILPNGLLSDYQRDITGAARAVYRPEDAYAGDLVSALGAINAGITTLLDWSHIGNSPEHTDAAMKIPSEFFAQMRAVFTLQRMLLLARQRAGETNLPNLLTVREVIELATIEGAKDNRLDQKVGTLTPGKEADIIMLRMDQIKM
jgi:cytosine/adenosine deaminase-related metal-dependent hydrolase